MADPNNPGVLGALSQLAYGSGGNPMAQVPELLDKVLPAASDRNEWLSFGAGMGAPTKTGALTEALGAGMAAQAESRLSRDKLRAQYMPLIMQSLIQSQQMTLAAGNAGRDWLKDVIPKVDSHLAALRTGNAEPTYEDVVSRALQLGEEYQIPPQVLMSKIRSIPRGPELTQYLDRLAVGTAGAKELIPTVKANAAGQDVATSGVRGTTQVLTPAGAPGAPQAANANPTSTFVDWQKATAGDVKTYEEGLRSRADAYRAMLSRMNEQAAFVNEFTPGRYAQMAGGIGAAIKDIGQRLPGVDKKTVEDLANKIMGAKEGSPQALAAQQLFEQLAQQETLAQLKTSLGEGQRMNMSEYQNFAKNNLGQAMDPETFKAMRSFYYRQAADATNRYKAWADYVADPGNKRPTVTGFDALHTQKEMDHYLSGNRGVVDASKPGASNPTYKEEPKTPMPPAPKPEAPAPAAAKPAAAQVDLSVYEDGARVGPTGKVYVMEKGVPRAAKPKAKAAPAAPGAPSLNMPLTLNGGPKP